MSEKTPYDAPPRAETDPPGFKLPTKRHLLEATGLAALVAVMLLVLFILPAEYGIDPTGMGELTGLNSLSGSDGGELELEGAGSIHRSEDAPPRNDTVTLVLDGLRDTEYKFHLIQNQSMLYSWTATGPVNFDFHGEPDEPERPGDFASHDAGQASGRDGSFQAPFTGRHGWYFQNVGNEPVTITLHTWGYYEVVGRLF